MSRLLRSFLCGLTALLWSQSARAQASNAAKTAAARELYEEAQKEMKDKNYRGACPKFERVVELAPDMENGLMALAECYVRLGRLASAWSLYVHLAAASGAHRTPAREAAKRLEPALAHLVVSAAGAVQRLPEIRVECDGVPVALSPQGTSIPVDRGSHVIVATARGKQRWETTVEVDADGSAQSVVILGLRDEPAPPRRWPPIDLDATAGMALRVGGTQIGPVVSGELGAFFAPVAWLAVGVAYEHWTLWEEAPNPSTSGPTSYTTRNVDTLWAALRLQAPQVGALRLSLRLAPGVSWQSVSTRTPQYSQGSNEPDVTCSGSDGPNLALRGGIGGDLSMGSSLSVVIDTAVDYVRLSGKLPCDPAPAPSALVTFGARAGLAYHFGR